MSARRVVGERASMPMRSPEVEGLEVPAFAEHEVAGTGFPEVHMVSLHACSATSISCSAWRRPS